MLCQLRGNLLRWAAGEFALHGSSLTATAAALCDAAASTACYNSTTQPTDAYSTHARAHSSCCEPSVAHHIYSRWLSATSTPSHRQTSATPVTHYTYLRGPYDTAQLLHVHGLSTSARTDSQDTARDPASSTSSQQQHSQTQAVQANRPLLFRLLPPATHLYLQLMRLDKPIGTWLLAWPCFWSIALAAPAGGPLDWPLMGLFGAGAVLLRGAGCTINDLWDRDLDKKVERTKTRPLAAGTVTVPQALGLLVAQLSAGFCILLQLNWLSIQLGASSLLLVSTYPLMKRITYWPQAVLGLTFNWGAMLGWTAAKGTFDPTIVLPLYGAGVAWTLVYDTIYAHQDKKDDLVAGVKSTALLFGPRTREICGGFAALTIAGLATAGWQAGLQPSYYAGLSCAAAHLLWQLRTVDLDNGASCMKTFVSNKYFGGIVFASILLGKGMLN